MGNKVKYNLKNVHWAPETESGYGEVKSWPGAVNLTLDPQGDDYTFYADGTAYFEYHTNRGYEGDFESAMIPEEFAQLILGELLDNNNNLVELEDVEAKKFALGFQIDGDKNESLYWFYNCTASRPSVSCKTAEESIEVQTESLTFSNKPDPKITVDGKHPVKVKTGSASAATPTSWFASVVLPDTTIVTG